jgi:hypothetical protein
VATEERARTPREVSVRPVLYAHAAGREAATLHSEALITYILNPKL